MERKMASSSKDEERQVVLRACDMCRKKKIRCEPTAEGCAQCTKFRTKCHFTPIATKRRPRRPAGFKYIAQLEQRLMEVEAVLGDKSLRNTRPTLDGPGPEYSTSDSSPSPDHTALISTNPGFDFWMALNEPLELAPDFMNTFETGLTGNLNAFGQTEADSNSFGGYIMDQQSSGSWQGPMADSRLISPLELQQLPSEEAGAELVNEFFINYNRFLPFMDEKGFRQDFQQKYVTSSPGDPEWWACLNVALSVAHRLRALRAQDSTYENMLAARHIQYALSVVSELNVRSLNAVQGLVGMACVLQGTPTPEPASMLVGAALRLAQSMDLHRELPDGLKSESESERRRRLFWKVYILDKDISLRSGKPFSQDDDDMDVRLPTNIGSDPSNVDLYNYRIGLAVIQGQVYKKLYSIRAARQTDAERALAAQELSSLLAYWRSSAQLDLPENSNLMMEGNLPGEMVHKIVLRLTYIHCLAMINNHLRNVGLSPPHNELGQLDTASNAGGLCLAESRSAIRLIEAIPQGDTSCVWMLLHAFYAAATSVLYHLIQNPAIEDAISDMHSVRPFMRLLEKLVRDPKTRSQSEELRKMYHGCKDLWDQAEGAIQTYMSGAAAFLT